MQLAESTCESKTRQICNVTIPIRLTNGEDAYGNYVLKCYQQDVK